MIEKLKLTPDDEAALRHLFEHRAFGQYFISQIGRTGMGGPIEFMPAADTMDMQTFIRRDDCGHYTQAGLEPAWWAFKEAARHTSAFGLQVMIEHANAWGWPTPHPWIPEGRNPQHVVKAEGASPDATDRGICANASPGGGPMGAGQAAAAAPAGVLGTSNDQRQVREDSQGLGEPGRLSPTPGVAVDTVTKPQCRDCADFAQDGICPNSGEPCAAGVTPAAPITDAMVDAALNAYANAGINSPAFVPMKDAMRKGLEAALGVKEVHRG